MIATGAGGEQNLSSGLYVLTLALPLHKSYPIMFDTTVEIFGTELWLRFRPLNAVDRTTPLDPSVSGGPFPVLDFDTHGLHYVAQVEFTTSQQALPSSSFNVDPVGLVTFDVHFEAEQPTCGRVAGEMDRPPDFPVDLTGSTFAFTLASDPDAHLAPIIDCAGNRAAPL